MRGNRLIAMQQLCQTPGVGLVRRTQSQDLTRNMRQDRQFQRTAGDTCLKMLTQVGR